MTTRFDDPEASRPKLPADVLAFVAEVDARKAKASPGPWKRVLAFDGYDIESANGEHVAQAFANNVDFVHHSIEDVPALIAIVRALFDEHVKDADRVKRYGDAYSYWLSRAAENDAAFVDARNKLIDETAQRELVEAERDELRERIAKLEALGPWIETNRLANLQWADESKARGDVNHREQCLIFEARADAFKQCGYELGIRAGKDLRK